VDAAAKQAAAAASAASYRSFAEATGTVLDILERHLVAATVFLAHIDAKQNLHRIVDTRGAAALGLRPNQTMPLSDSLCAPMVEDRAPRLCNDVPADPVYGPVPARRRWLVHSYVAVPLELSDGTRVGSLAALSRRPGRFVPADEQLLTMLARVLVVELERESGRRQPGRSDDTLRSGARGFEAVSAVALAQAGGADARPVVCRTAAELSGATAVFLLEPSGREFASTAAHGVEMGPVTIQPRGDGPGRAFQSTESYFVADARDHAALAPALVEATGARSALFEPIVRDGEVCAVLILIWRHSRTSVDPAVAEALRLLAAQAAAAITHASLQQRIENLALTDPLTGLVTRRSWDEELPRELARARRSQSPVCIALLDVDDLRAFCMVRGESEGDRLIKETASLWDRQLREVDTLARLQGDEFAIILPNCDLDSAVEVVDRVRAATPREQTASAGVARWDGEEPAELLAMRCMDALSEAKAAGGDRILTAE
jgi:diguanylate cyclase (GGDEF)-like protein